MCLTHLRDLTVQRTRGKVWILLILVLIVVGDVALIGRIRPLANLSISSVKCDSLDREVSQALQVSLSEFTHAEGSERMSAHNEK